MWTTYFSRLTTRILDTLFPKKCISCTQEGEVICSACLQEVPRVVETPYTWITSLYSYKHRTIKKSIHAMKYFHRKDIAEFFGKELAQHIDSHLYKDYILLPVPMERVRRLIRGHNHTISIAQTLHESLDLPIDTTLIPVAKHHKRQVTTHTKRERYKNKKGVFALRREVAGKSFIIIDDVTTTGATLLELRTVLLQGGARDVVAYTVAH